MISEWYFGVLFVVVSFAFAAISVIVVRRRFAADVLRRDAEVAAPIHAALGVIYGVLLGFVVLTVWEEYDEAKTSVAREASMLTALYRDAGAFGDTVSGGLRNAIRNYSQSVVDYEWRLMQQGEGLELSNVAYEEVWRAIRNVVPTNTREEVWLEGLVARMNDIGESRTLRLLAVDAAVPVTMWILLLSGGLITVLFACFFGAERTIPHLMMVGSLSAVIAFVLFMIAAIDHPFVGAVTVQPDPYIRTLFSSHPELLEDDTARTAPASFDSTSASDPLPAIDTAR